MKFVSIALALGLAGCVTSEPAVNNTGRPAQGALSTATQDATAAFITACINTSKNPNAALPALLSLGFKEIGTRKGMRRFKSATATAALSSDSNGGGLGQCSVTPKGGNFPSSVAALNQQIGRATISAKKLSGEAAWIIGSTGAIAIVARKEGAFTRTQPNVLSN